MKDQYEMYRRSAAVNMAEEDGKIWMPLLTRNGICEVDAVTKHARICKLFEEESLLKECLYGHVKKADKYLIFPPAAAEKIAIYNLENDLVTYIPLKTLEHDYKESKGEAKFWNTFQYRSEVYLLGYSYPAIVRINMESMETTYITDWVEEVETHIETGDSRGYFSEGYVFDKDKVLIPVGCMKAVLKLDLKTACTELIELPVSMSGVGGMDSPDGEHVWLVGKGNKTNRVSCWNMRTDKIKEYIIDDIDGNILDPFHAPICTRDKVFLLPIAASYIYEVNTHTGAVKKNKLLERILKNVGNALWPWWKTMAQRLQGEVLTFVTCGDFKWYEYNTATGEIQSFFVHLEEETRETEQYFRAMFSEQNKEKTVITESRMPSNYFFDQVINKDNNIISQKSRRAAGAKIYEQICSYET